MAMSARSGTSDGGASDGGAASHQYGADLNPGEKMSVALMRTWPAALRSERTVPARIPSERQRHGARRTECSAPCWSARSYLCAPLHRHHSGPHHDPETKLLHAASTAAVRHAYDAWRALSSVIGHDGQPSTMRAHDDGRRSRLRGSAKGRSVKRPLSRPC